MAKIYKQKIIARAMVGSDAALVRAGAILEREAKTLLSKGGGSVGAPSAPGEPPHLQSGALRSSVHHALAQDGLVVVGPTEKYGAVHEFGSATHPPRPFMRPALRNKRREILKEFRNIL